MKKYDVTFQRSDFAEALQDWELVSDVCKGQRAVKAKRTKYLPTLNADDNTQEGLTRYYRYIERAHFLNFTGRTLEGLIGAVFRKEPVLELPSLLEYCAANVDGQGIGLAQQSKDALTYVLQNGRHALYVDFPVTDKAVTVSARQSGEFNATIKSVQASSVVNWQTTAQGSQIKLTLVVMRETVEEVTEDGFGQTHVDQYRVLRLLEGVYQVEIWRKNESGEWAMIDAPVVPKDGAGRSLDEIPFAFVGANNNDSAVDRAPLLDLANLNIAHYRNSADYEDSVFYVGQAQPYITGLDETWRDHLEAAGIAVGSRSPILLPVGGQYGFAQVQPNMVSFEAMAHKEEQAKALGARLLEKGLAVKTATQASADSASEHSVLSLVVSNVNDAYRKALEWLARFMNVSGKVEFVINQEFVAHQLDPQTLTALVSAWQTGKLVSKNDVWAYLRRVGVIDSEKTDDDIEGELDADDTGLGLEDGIDVSANKPAPDKKDVSNGASRKPA
jgi:hypothetical protein